jgi:hypothetical protein
MYAIAAIREELINALNVPYATNAIICSYSRRPGSIYPANPSFALGFSRRHAHAREVGFRAAH